MGGCIEKPDDSAHGQGAVTRGCAGISGYVPFIPDCYGPRQVEGHTSIRLSWRRGDRAGERLGKGRNLKGVLEMLRVN